MMNRKALQVGVLCTLLAGCVGMEGTAMAAERAVVQQEAKANASAGSQASRGGKAVLQKTKEVKQAGITAEQKAKLDKELEALVGEGPLQVPGLCVIGYRDGKEVYRKAAGRAYVDERDSTKDRAVTADTRFRVASVSKMFVDFALMKLVEEGKINLDEDCSRYLGMKLRNPNYPEIPITVRMLALHTSSLRDGSVYGISSSYSLKEFFTPGGMFWEEGKHFAPKGQKPGEYFEYCNLNYGVLGTVIEAVTGERFDEYQKKSIFKPLDIQADYVPGNFSEEEFEKLGTIYRKVNEEGVWNENGSWYGKADNYKGKKPKAEQVIIQNPYAKDYNPVSDLTKYQPGTNATVFSPQGGLRISAEELGHALEMLLNDGNYRGTQVLSKASVQEILKQQWVYDAEKKNGSTYNGTIQSYGLGNYKIYGDRQGSRVCKDKVVDLIGHEGEAYGMMSGLFFQPAQKNGFVYVMNGTAVKEDADSRSLGTFSGHYIWEEEVMNPICNILMDEN